MRAILVTSFIGFISLSVATCAGMILNLTGVTETKANLCRFNFKG